MALCRRLAILLKRAEAAAPPAAAAGRRRSRGKKVAISAASSPSHFDLGKRFGVDDSLRGKLRFNLLRAGYFRSDAINFYKCLSAGSPR